MLALARSDVSSVSSVSFKENDTLVRLSILNGAVSFLPTDGKNHPPYYLLFPIRLHLESFVSSSHHIGTVIQNIGKKKSSKLTFSRW